MLKIAVVCLLVAGVAVAEDSPLVAAAKRTNRAKPKAKVITNEGVANSQGRLSVASGSHKPISLPPSSAPSTEQKPATTAKKAPAPPAAPQRKDYQPPGYVAPVAITTVAPMGVEPASATSIQPQSSQVPAAPVSSQQPKP